MRYVQQVLQPGEVVRRTGSLHWTIYLPGLLFTLAALVTIGWAEWGAGGNMFSRVLTILFAIVACCGLPATPGKRHSVPWSALRYDEVQQAYVAESPPEPG